MAMAEEELSTVTDTSPAQPTGTSCGGKQNASHEIYCTVKEMYHPVIPSAAPTHAATYHSGAGLGHKRSPSY